MPIIIKRIDPRETVRRYCKEKNLTFAQTSIMQDLAWNCNMIAYDKTKKKNPCWYLVRVFKDDLQIIESYIDKRDAKVIIGLDIIKPKHSDEEFKVGVALGAYPNTRYYLIDRKKLLKV